MASKSGFQTEALQSLSSEASSPDPLLGVRYTYRNHEEVPTRFDKVFLFQVNFSLWSVWRMTWIPIGRAATSSQTHHIPKGKGFAIILKSSQEVLLLASIHLTISSLSLEDDSSFKAFFYRPKPSFHTGIVSASRSLSFSRHQCLTKFTFNSPFESVVNCFILHQLENQGRV